MKELSLADISRQIETLREEFAQALRRGDDLETIAVSAAEVARLLNVDRKTVYEMHYAEDLNGFRPRPNSHLKFLLSEVREVARKKSEKREGA